MTNAPQPQASGRRSAATSQKYQARSQKPAASSQKLLLPHPTGLLRYHGPARFTSKGLLKFRHVLHDAVDAPAAGGVRVYADTQAQDFRCDIFTPHAAVAEEEALIGGEAVNQLVGVLFGLTHKFVQGHEGDAGAAVVGGVFAEGEACVEFEVVHGGEAAVFVGDTAGAFLELLAVFGGPPVAQIALGVELSAFAVEALGQFAADPQADATEVDRVIHGAVEERRLQDSGRAK